MKTDLYANLGWPRGTYTQIYVDLDVLERILVLTIEKTVIGENKKVFSGITSQLGNVNILFVFLILFIHTFTSGSFWDLWL
jgi:hypothetical protein